MTYRRAFVDRGPELRPFLHGIDDLLFTSRTDGFAALGAIGFDSPDSPITAGIARTSDAGAHWLSAWSARGSSVTWIGRAGAKLRATATTWSNGKPHFEVLDSSDAGRTWNVSTSRLPSGVDDWSAEHFSFADAGFGLGVPDPVEAPPGFQSIGSNVLRTLDGGRTWNFVALPEKAIPAGGVAALSVSRAFVTASTTSCAGELLETMDAGVTWSVVPGTCEQHGLTSLDFVDATNGFVGGGDSIDVSDPQQLLLATIDGGRSWQQRFLSHVQPSAYWGAFTQLAFVDRVHGWAVIGGCKDGQNPPCARRLSRTDDGGRSWVDSDKEGSLLAVSAPGDIWLGEASGNILMHTTDDGRHWHVIKGRGGVPIFSINPSRRGPLLRDPDGYFFTGDGGKTWKQLRSLTLEENAGFGPVVSDASDMIIASPDGLEVSRDDGRRFQHVRNPTARVDQMSLGAAESLIVQNGDQCSPTSIYGSDDHGRKWDFRAHLPHSDLDDIAVRGPHVLAITHAPPACVKKKGVRPPPPLPNEPSDASGPYRIAESTDGGRTWRSRSMPSWQNCFTLALATDGSAWLACRSMGGSRGGGIAVSRDAGATWRVLTGLSLYTDPYVSGPALAPFGSREVWATDGEQLLRTTDGGRHWRGFVPDVPTPETGF